jgi:hypothetical protein
VIQAHSRRDLGRITHHQASPTARRDQENASPRRLTTCPDEGTLTPSRAHAQTSPRRRCFERDRRRLRRHSGLEVVASRLSGKLAVGYMFGGEGDEVLACSNPCMVEQLNDEAIEG